MHFGASNTCLILCIYLSEVGLPWGRYRIWLLGAYFLKLLFSDLWLWFSFAIIFLALTKDQHPFGPPHGSASTSKFCCFNTAEWSAMSRMTGKLMSFCILCLWEFSVTDLYHKQVPDYFFVAFSNTEFIDGARTWVRKGSIVSSQLPALKKSGIFDKHLGIKCLSDFPGMTWYYNHKAPFLF